MSTFVDVDIIKKLLNTINIFEINHCCRRHYIIAFKKLLPYYFKDDYVKYNSTQN